MVQNIMKTTVEGEVKSIYNLDNLDRRCISIFDDLENVDGSCILDHNFYEKINQYCTRSDEGDSGWSFSQGFRIQSSLNVGNVKTMDYLKEDPALGPLKKAIGSGSSLNVGNVKTTDYFKEDLALGPLKKGNRIRL